MKVSEIEPSSLHKDVKKKKRNGGIVTVRGGWRMMLLSESKKTESQLETVIHKLSQVIL